MDVGRRDLGEVKKLFEQGREREPEPRIELLLGEVDSVVRGFLGGYDLSVHKLNGHAIRNAEAFTELPHVQLVNRLFRIYHPRRILAALPGCTGRNNVFFRRKRGAETEPAWQDANSKKQGPDPAALTTKTLRKPKIPNIPILTLGSTPKRDRSPAKGAGRQQEP